jgi:hypothetical protein
MMPTVFYDGLAGVCEAPANIFLLYAFNTIFFMWVITVALGLLEKRMMIGVLLAVILFLDLWFTLTNISFTIAFTSQNIQVPSLP